MLWGKCFIARAVLVGQVVSNNIHLTSATLVVKKLKLLVTAIEIFEGQRIMSCVNI